MSSPNISCSLSWICGSIRSVGLTGDRRSVQIVIKSSQASYSIMIISYILTMVVTGWVPLVENELLTLLEHLSSHSVFGWRSCCSFLLFCVQCLWIVFVNVLCLLFTTVLSFSIDLWLFTSWYLLTLLTCHFKNKNLKYEVELCVICTVHYMEIYSAGFRTNEALC